MTREQLKAKFPYASEAFLDANSLTERQEAIDRATRAIKNPDGAFVGAVAGPKCKHLPVPALVARKANHPGRKSRVVILVEIIRFGRKELDGDNFVAGAKPIRDCIATSLGVDDADKRIQWDYQQVVTAGQTGTLVRIQRIK